MLRHAHGSPKLSHLKALLGISRYQAVGLLECLWHFTATQAPRGDVGKWSDEVIAAALEWEGSAGELVDALCTARWLDTCSKHRLVVHDWEHHSDQTVKRNPSVKSLGFARASTSDSLASDERGTGAAPDSLNPGSGPEPDLGSSSSLASLEKTTNPASLPAGESVPGPKAEEPEEPELELGTRALRAVAKAIWPRCVAAAAQHGKPWTAEQPNETRLRFMTGRLREHAREPPEILVEAIHGAVAFWRKAAPKDFDLTARLVPETIYAATNFTKYLEAYREKKPMNGHKHERDPHGSEEITF